ncbi:serine protease [Cardiosporidium cionae]|uniref:Serine protease n=1 Tax=Cardiosporidium cionae TaxID=476202 RepID=A0ABQ7JE04_9APIC|nr:serine protease [Cardiosporidium cionae]|eukprot:KAF8822248.1 serine protease [Cardiosporidium cionae]
MYCLDIVLKFILMLPLGLDLLLKIELFFRMLTVLLGKIGASYESTGKFISPTKYSARVIAVAHECDLAVLTVDDESFWSDITPLEFGDVPHLQDAVVVVGYPTGGDNLCITSGVVSRVDVTTYSHSNFSNGESIEQFLLEYRNFPNIFYRLLCAQIDAAINPGNSGGPVFKDGKIVGIAFQGYDDAQNIGYVVPSPIIHRFLNDLEKNKHYTGFVTLGVTYQPLENKNLRDYVGIDNLKDIDLPPNITRSGILVIQSDKLRDEQYIKKMEKENTPISADSIGFRRNDVILALDGIDVADDGTVFFRSVASVNNKKFSSKKSASYVSSVCHFMKDKERVHLSHAISHKFTGDSAVATILRDHKIRNTTISLTSSNFIVPEHQWDKRPRYYIFGGLVFCPLSMEYLKDEFGKKFYERAPSTLLQPLMDIFSKQEKQEAVILSQVNAIFLDVEILQWVIKYTFDFYLQILASDLTIGYDFRNVRLLSVNGKKVNNLKHLVEMLEGGNLSATPANPSSQEVTNYSESEVSNNSRFVVFEFDHKLQVVLERQKAIEMNADILQQHAIAAPRTEEI